MWRAGHAPQVNEQVVRPIRPEIATSGLVGTGSDVIRPCAVLVNHPFCRSPCGLPSPIDFIDRAAVVLRSVVRSSTAENDVKTVFDCLTSQRDRLQFI